MCAIPFSVANKHTHMYLGVDVCAIIRNDELAKWTIPTKPNQNRIDGDGFSKPFTLFLEYWENDFENGCVLSCDEKKKDEPTKPSNERTNEKGKKAIHNKQFEL